LIVLMAVTADQIILIILGPQWVQASTIFRYLSLAAFFLPILYTAGWVWLSMGRTRELFHWSLLTTPSFIASFALGLPWGVEGVALAYAICVTLLTPVGLLWSYRGTRLRWAEAISAVLMPYSYTALVLGLALVLQQVLPAWPPYLLAPVVCAGAMCGALALTFWVPAMRRDMAFLWGLLAHLRGR